MNARLRFAPWIILGGILAVGSVVIPVVVPGTVYPGRTTLVTSQRRSVEKKFILESASAIQVPILMYHYIRTCDDPEDKNCPALSVSPSTFDQQLAWLRDHGYVTVDLDYFSHPYAVEGKPVVITFDDGYADNFTTAVPLLERYGFTATFYLITDRVGQPEYLTWAQARSMLRRGMTIGSHSEDHADSTKVDVVALKNETEKSKRMLEDQLGRPIDDFCYPYGIYDQRVLQAVRDAGYATATTTKEGIAERAADLLQLPRVRMKENTDLQKAIVLTGQRSDAS